MLLTHQWEVLLLVEIEGETADTGSSGGDLGVTVLFSLLSKNAASNIFHLWDGWGSGWIL